METGKIKKLRGAYLAAAARADEAETTLNAAAARAIDGAYWAAHAAHAALAGPAAVAKQKYDAEKMRQKNAADCAYRANSR